MNNALALLKATCTLLTLAVLFVFTDNTFAQKNEPTAALTGVQPVYVEGNPTCADLNADNQRFPNVLTDLSFSYGSQPVPLEGVSHTFTNEGIIWRLGGGANPDNHTLFLQGSRYDPESDNINQVLWWSTRSITAVIITGKPGANVYPYPGAGVTSDAGLRSPRGEQIYHLMVCYNHSPTAASAMISGRVLSATGNPLSRAMISVLNTSTSQVITTQTNTFGNYAIDRLEVGTNYIVSVQHGKYNFTTSARAVTLGGDVSDIDFVADPR